MSMILHHYPLSPYSEKIRAMFGYTNLEWTSCITSEAPPRGQLNLLSGGYGRVPIAQVGADIFCDSSLIADEISELANKPQLSDRSLNPSALKQRHWLESTLFFACINRAFSVSLLKRIAQDRGLFNLMRFLNDRIQMGIKASVPMGSPKSAPKHIQLALNELSCQIGAHHYVGGGEPNVIDYAAYHCFWFLSEVGQKNDLHKQQKLSAWYQRMHAFSREASQEISLEQALNDAKNSEPRSLDRRYLQDPRIGSNITISPSDYRKSSASGILVGGNDRRWIVLCESKETGPIHLHFPTKDVDVRLRLG